jgi:uncharacterized protein YfbU (UPF0304 family)
MLVATLTRRPFCAPLLEGKTMSFVKAIIDCQYKRTDHMTDGFNSNTVPLIVQFRTLYTTGSACSVQTDEGPRELSALNGDAMYSSPLRHANSSQFL